MSAEKKPASAAQPAEDKKFFFDTRNYILFAVGILLIVVGFITMSGGGSKDPNVFNPDIFSSTRITVAPILVLTGFAVNMFAIMLRPKN